MSCVRCGRPACPDCMRSASVGQQCVDCVKQGSQGARQARTVFGGRPSSPQAAAIVTYTLIGINILLFIVELARPALGQDWAMLGYAYYPGGGPLHGVAAGEWYRLITSAFLPPAVTGANASGLGILDILLNMYALYIVGPTLERVLGKTRFIGVYLVSAIGGSVMFYYLAPQNLPALGASGAIFGLFGAWFVVARRLRLDARGIVALIVLNLVFSFLWRSTIAWQAHIGGLLAGVLITVAYAYAPRKNQALVQITATVLVIAVAVVAVLLRTHQLHQQLTG